MRAYISRILEFFKMWRDIWLGERFVNRYGPDLATRLSRGPASMDPREIERISREWDRIALENWSQEGHDLLPFRYRKILEKLLGEGLISQEEHDTYSGSAEFAIMSPGGGREYTFDEEVDVADIASQIVWQARPEILSRTSDKLSEKIDEFETDLHEHHSHTKGVLFTEEMLGL